MIGVLAHANERDIVAEFFELFKTPWEFASAGRHYPVVLSTTGRVDGLHADLFVMYGSQQTSLDRQAGSLPQSVEGVAETSFDKSTFPIYGRLATFGLEPGAIGFQKRSVEYMLSIGERRFLRIGYDLFEEIRFLLTQGQPISHASIPTLDLHIQRLRSAILDAGISLIEVPATPYGYDFSCCLTHDVDFFGIRRHRFDRTLAGFLLRASIGTGVDLVRGRRTFGEALRNWRAALGLPLVLLGVARDFWRPFEQYARADRGLPSTFFLVPFKHRPGEAPNGSVDVMRGVPYQISEIRDEAGEALKRRSELAVHGIDAWREPAAGVSEMRELVNLTGRQTAGIRMHWLYFSDDSPRHLDAAGFSYDSTWGYNETVGYKAGTAQVFRFPGTQTLLELPLTIMDSALFSRGRLGLTRSEAQDRWRRIIGETARHGGVLVVNWHERSLAPERLWGESYRELIDDISTSHQVWFATGSAAVDWFRWRRSIRFADAGSGGRHAIEVTAAAAISTPAIVRRYTPGTKGTTTENVPFDGSTAIRFQTHSTAAPAISAI